MFDFVKATFDFVAFNSVAGVNGVLLLICRLWKDGRLSWPGWLTYSGRFTHLVTGQRPTFYHCAILCHATSTKVDRHILQHLMHWPWGQILTLTARRGSACWYDCLFLYFILKNNYSVSQKNQYTFVHSFGKCRPIYNILSLSDSWVNSVCNGYRVFHLILTVLLHYLAKFKI